MKQKMYMYKRIVEAKLFIDDNYHSSIDLEKIADSAYYSKYHFLRLFKQAFGLSPHQYLRTVRIKKAKLLLKEGKSVSEVCFSVGFESLPSFTNLFKKHIGVSPKNYKQQFEADQIVLANTPLQFIPNCYVESFGWNNSNSQ